MYTITVRRRGPQGCIGAGPCITVAPKVFAMGDDNIAVVIDPNGADAETVLEAAKACPVEAIVIDDENGERLFPK